MLVLLAPILPHTSEEAYSFMPGEKLESIHLLDMPKVKKYKDFDENLWTSFFNVKDDVNKALEEARDSKLIGSSLEANVLLHLSDKYNPVKEVLGKYMNQLLIVSKVTFTDEKLTKYDNVEVKIEKSSGHKCARCWNYVDELEGDICHRCAKILKKDTKK
jgi:isoleucyl-tRNA synthetase